MEIYKCRICGGKYNTEFKAALCETMNLLSGNYNHLKENESDELIIKRLYEKCKTETNRNENKT